MNPRKPKYYRVPLRKIEERLRAQGFSSAYIKLEIDKVRDERAATRSAKSQRRRNQVLWRYLITPLSKEIANARVGANYTPAWTTDGDDLVAVEQRKRAFERYVLVLETLRRKLTELAQADPPSTPKQVVKMLADANRALPNEGEHWVDWVKPSDKEEVSRLFAALPVRKQAKRKEPFQRTVPLSSARERRGLLERAILSERATHERALSVLVVDPQRQSGQAQLEVLGLRDKHSAKIILLNMAFQRLYQKRDTAPLPHTWHGLLTDEELAQYGETRPAPAPIDHDELKAKLIIKKKEPEQANNDLPAWVNTPLYEDDEDDDE